MRVRGNIGLRAKSFRIAACILLLAASIIPLFEANQVSAAQITSRTLTLQAGATDGGSKAGGVVNHYFEFTLPTAGDVGSIKFEYCTIAVGTCEMPTGLVTTSATLGYEEGATGFSMVNTTNGAPYLTRTVASISSNTAAKYRLETVTNPTTENASFFVRITSYASTDTTGSATDSGVVTASTATQIVLTGIMPESIIFCTGGDITVTSSIPDCSSATSGAISFNQLFSPSDTATASSAMAASTNATNGYSIAVYGTTLTSGSNTIPAMSTAGIGVRGTGQFGLNLVANTTATSDPAIGADLNPVSNDTDLKGLPATDYGTADTFKFNTSGEVIATSASGGAGPTNSQKYTVSYIVNVAGSQIAGTYTTTLTYICTATF